MDKERKPIIPAWKKIITRTL